MLASNIHFWGCVDLGPGSYYKESIQDIDLTPQYPDPLTRVKVESTISTIFTIKITYRNQAQAPRSRSHNLVIVLIYNV